MDSEESGNSTRWKALVGAAVTSVTIITGVFAIWDWWQSHPRFDLTGQWSFTNTIDSTSFRPYQGLRLGYDVFLQQNGSNLSGTGEKRCENGVEQEHTPVKLKGSISGTTVKVDFTEEGAKRPSTGTYNWTYEKSSGRLKGAFISTAAEAQGSSLGERVKSTYSCN